MPTISRFYGIVIQMYWDERHGPHFHALYAEYRAQISILNGEILRGTLPPRASRFAREWLEQHRAELLENWNRARTGQELIQIEGLE
ncbi:MAG TPA: DUF4160 domain-containing protein [Anaerolineae bacterium]|nr:DUF4160 domain-containing protein [Anaerolineae bacterium]